MGSAFTLLRSQGTTHRCPWQEDITGMEMEGIRHITRGGRGKMPNLLREVTWNGRE